MFQYAELKCKLFEIYSNLSYCIILIFYIQYKGKFKLKQKWRGVLELGSWGTGLLIGSIVQTNQYHPANPIYRRVIVKIIDQQQSIVRIKGKRGIKKKFELLN